MNKITPLGVYKLVVVVAESQKEVITWCKSQGIPRERCVYAHEPSKLLGLDETLVGDVVELVDNHPVMRNRHYMRLKERVEEFKARSPYDHKPDPLL